LPCLLCRLAVSLSIGRQRQPFSGHKDFHETMSHTDFQDICAAIQFHSFDCFDFATMEEDPLYHSRMIINHFL
jgi:hypothetical protein